MSRIVLHVVVFCCLLVMPTAGSAVVNSRATADEPFPLYAVIKPNVEFWRAIYSRHPLSEGLIHDKEDLSLIYEVVKFSSPQAHGVSATNQRRVSNLKDKYRDILTRLADGRQPADSDEKRVLALFGPKPDRQRMREAAGNLRFQLGQQDRFKEGVVRSGAYLDTMRSIFRQYDLPEDLVYMAHVESSFNPMAYSKFGASGVWQFTHATGKRFLNVGYALDERRDPIRATHAAARYLKENFELLGAWPLAITAYNHGAAGLLRAREANGGYEAIFRNHRTGSFQFASRNFYSEFLAAREVASNYRDYFGELALQKPTPVHELTLPGYVSVSALADYFRIDIEVLQDFNPALREPVFQGQKYVPKGYALRLPLEKRPDVVQLAERLPDNLLLPKQKRSRFYRVQRGDTAGSIARSHDVSLNDLVLANQLNRRATIYIGQNLRIPGEGEQVAEAPAKKSAGATGQSVEPVKPVAATPKPVLAPEPVKKPVVAEVKAVPVAEPAVPQPIVLAAVAEVPGSAKIVAPQALPVPESDAPAADMPGPEVGQLAVPPAEDGGSTEEGAIEVPPQVEVNPAVLQGDFLVEEVLKWQGRPVGIIRVQVGETLGHYAEWLELRASDLRRLNGLRFGKAININQQLKIPLDKIGKDEFEERRYEFHKEVEEDFFAAFRVAGLQKYRVKSGDTIWSLSRDEFDLPLWLLKKYNANLELGRLQLHQEMVVPVVEENS